MRFITVNHLEKIALKLLLFTKVEGWGKKIFAFLKKIAVIYFENQSLFDFCREGNGIGELRSAPLNDGSLL